MHKVLIANRGPIARRIVRACAALKISSVVVFAPADAEAPYLSEATEAYPLIGNTALETYLDQAPEGDERRDTLEHLTMAREGFTEYHLKRAKDLRSLLDSR